MLRYALYFVIVTMMFGCTSKKDFTLFSKTGEYNKKDTTPVVQETHYDNVEFEYKIIPHDRVSLIVYKHPELSLSTLGSNRNNDRGLLINSEGDIRLPLVKEIHIAGLTQTEAQEKVESAFKRYIKSPDVYLEVLNKRAYVVGEVNTPGEIELTNEKISLLQLLAQAGDMKDTANRQSIMILRSGKDRVHSQIVDLTDFNSLKTANLMIKPNDIVYVTPNNMKAFNVGVNEISPIFNLIGGVLTQFVQITYLTRN